MTLTTSPAAFDALAPLRLQHELRLTPEQFELVFDENREAVLEMAADGRVIAMTPTGSWKVCGSSSGFHLPDGTVLSPDASVIRLDSWQALTAA